MPYQVLDAVQAGDTTDAAHFNQIRENLELSAGSLARAVQRAGVIVSSTSANELSLSEVPDEEGYNYLAVVEGGQVNWHRIGVEPLDVPTLAEMDRRYLPAAAITARDKTVLVITGAQALAGQAGVTQGATTGLALRLAAITDGYRMTISWTGTTPATRVLMLVERATGTNSFTSNLPIDDQVEWIRGSANLKSDRSLSRFLSDFLDYQPPVIGIFENNTVLDILGTFTLSQHTFILSTQDNLRREEDDSLYDLGY